MQRLVGKHVVVTGAGKGIGKAIAERLADEGAALSLLGLDVEALHEVAAALGAGATECDIRDRGSVDAAFAAAAAERGPIHALVANSGLGGPNEDGPGDRFDDLVATNLAGTYYCVRAAVRNLAPGPDPRHVVVISSILARIAVPGYTGYSRLEGGAARPRALVRGGAGGGERPGERDLPGVGGHRHDGTGAGRARRGDRRHARGRPPRGDARRPARPDGPARRDRRHGRLAALRRRARRHRPGDRPERRRLGRADMGRGARGRPFSQRCPRPQARARRMPVESSSRCSICSSSSSVPMRTGPLNHLLAERTYQPPNSRQRAADEDRRVVDDASHVEPVVPRHARLVRRQQEEDRDEARPRRSRSGRSTCSACRGSRRRARTCRPSGSAGSPGG